MYNIIRESILAPKQLIKYHSKKGWFVFLYILFLAVLLSIDMFIILIADNNPTVNNQTTQCEIVDNRFVCQETPIEDQDLTVYNIPLYFLSDNQEVTDVVLGDLDIAIIVKDQFVYYRVGTSTMTALDATGYASVSEFYASIKTSIAGISAVFTVIQNLLIMMFIILISTIPFLRFRKEIRYKKIFKMVVFASTPIAILLLITNLLNLSTLLFFILMFIGYRSIFSLQKELYVRSMMRRQQRSYEESRRKTDDIDEDNVIDQEEDEDQEEE